jgi:hypothetical protein
MHRPKGLSWMLIFICIFAVASNAAAQWKSDGAAVCMAEYDQRNPVIVSDYAGGAIVAWEDQRNFGTAIYVQRVDAGGNTLWTEDGVAVCTYESEQQQCRMIPDGYGGAIIAWQDYRMGPGDIYAQRVDAGGNLLWAAEGVAICAADNEQWDVRLMVYGAAGAILTWTDTRSGDMDIYAQRIESSGNAVWTADGVAVVTQTNGQYSPQIGSDGSDGAIIAWFDFRNSFSEIYAQRIGSDGNAQWTADGVCVRPDGGYQYDMSFVSGASGVIFAWSEYRDYYQDIYLQRLDLSGAPLWDEGGIVACAYESDKFGPQLVPDFSGGAMLAWYDSRGYNYSVFAQRVSSGGELMYPESGIMVFDAIGESEIHITADGFGGAIVALDAYFDEAESSDIYAQRLDGNGNLLWSLPRGAAVCTAPLGQYVPVLVNDEFGGAIIVWEDERSEMDWNIYAQRVGPSGLWGNPEPAILSCLDVPGDQGGWVRIRTGASSHDVAGEYDSPIAGYNVWRLIDGGGGPMAASAGVAAATAFDRAGILALLTDPKRATGISVDAYQAAALGLPEGEWESVGFWFAMRDSVYNIAVPTRNDSTEAGTAEETFVVTAHTSSAGIFVVSEAATGYSVDNLAPGMTSGFAGDEVAAPPGLRLTWAANDAPDLWKYDIHRGDDEFFIPDASNRIGSTETTEFFDGDWMKANMDFYKLVAVDRHGNGSPAALLRPEDINVGVLLQSYAASLAGSCIEISWSLSELGPGTSFFVLRSESAGASFAELAPAAIEREGLYFSFKDRSIEPGTTYRYRIDVADESGRRTLFETDAITIPAIPLALHQNHPNPFNPSTVISYYLPEASPVTLEIFDLSGKLIARLRDGVRENRGTHSVEWRGMDDAGRAVSSGVYFYRLRAGRETLSRKLVLIR